MKIETQTLVTVAQQFFARYDAATHGQSRADMAFEAVGMLRAFVEGYREAEAEDVRRYEAMAHIPDAEEDPF